MQNIVKALYVYADAVKFLELKASEITSAGFSQQTLVLRSPGLPGLFCCPCMISVLTCLKKKKKSHGRGRGPGFLQASANFGVSGNIPEMFL